MHRLHIINAQHRSGAAEVAQHETLAWFLLARVCCATGLTLWVLVAWTPPAAAQTPSEMRVYRVAILGYLEESESAGFTPALLREIGKASGVVFEFIQMRQRDTVAGLEDGSVDLMNMIRTPRRTQDYELSQPHSQNMQAIFRHSASDDIVDLKSLSGHTVGMKEGDLLLEQLASRTDFTRVTFPSTLRSLLTLDAGKIDAFLCTQRGGVRLIRKYRLANVELGAMGLLPQDVCFATAKGNRELIALLNRGLDALRHSGRLDELRSRWPPGQLPKKSWVETHQNLLITLGALVLALLIVSLAWNIVLQRIVKARKYADRERKRLISELEAKNAEMERFTYTVSHDLKAPLITIRGFLGFLEKDTAAGEIERAKRDIEQIDSAAAKMQRLLGELLKLSQIGRVVDLPQEVSLVGLAHEVVDMLAGRIAERGAKVEIAPDLPAVHGDRARLFEVLQNLICNAVEFMGAQPDPRVEIGARRDGEETVFYVRDNGLGIDSRHHEKIFGLFNRLDPESDGTGIGLALAKRIVEVHGGRIWVESEGRGRGSTFCFSIPQKGALATHEQGRNARRARHDSAG